jgi:hypothetical protein
LRDAAKTAFSKEGKRMVSELGYFEGFMGRFWVDAGRYEGSQSERWLKRWSLTGGNDEEGVGS